MSSPLKTRPSWRPTGGQPKPRLLLQGLLADFRSVAMKFHAKTGLAGGNLPFGPDSVFEEATPQSGEEMEKSCIGGQNPREQIVKQLSWLPRPTLHFEIKAHLTLSKANIDSTCTTTHRGLHELHQPQPLSGQLSRGKLVTRLQSIDGEIGGRLEATGGMGFG